MKINRKNVNPHWLLILASFFFMSCAVQAQNIKPNRKSFAYVKATVDVHVPECKVDEKTKQKTCIMKKLGKKTALGSGTFFKYKNTKAFLSAGHVCLGPAFGIWPDLPNTSKVMATVSLQSYTGKIIKGQIRYVNIKYDICIIDITHPDLRDNELPKVSVLKPQKDRDFYAVAAPVGIFATGMVPVYEGKYQGDSAIFSFYTIPTAPGASGAPIYNSNGRIVGVIQRTNMAFKEITLSIKFKDLSNVLERYEEITKEGLSYVIE